MNVCLTDQLTSTPIFKFSKPSNDPSSFPSSSRNLYLRFQYPLLSHPLSLPLSSQSFLHHCYQSTTTATIIIIIIIIITIKPATSTKLQTIISNLQSPISNIANYLNLSSPQTYCSVPQKPKNSLIHPPYLHTISITHPKSQIHLSPLPSILHPLFHPIPPHPI